ncbi:MAG: NAD(P)/FAD-dependent oxidoreductase [Actinomycetes bacterium]
MSPAGGCLWSDQLGQAVARRPALASDAEADVCVVGGGYTGLWTARWLLEADPSLRVLVLEAETVGFGASGRNGGWASALFPTSAWALARRHGRPAAAAMRRTMRTAVGALGDAVAADGIACDWLRGGTVVVARTPVQLDRAREEVHSARLFGVDELHLLDADEVCRHVTASGALGGTWTPDCARVQPAQLVRGLAAAVERRGGRIVEGTPALAVAPGRVRTVTGTVRCDQVVLATEAWTPAFAGHRRDVVPVYSLVVATEPLDDATWARIGLAGGETFSEHRYLVVYGQRTADGRLVLGGRGRRTTRAPGSRRASTATSGSSAGCAARRSTCSRCCATSASPTPGADRWASRATGTPASATTRRPAPARRAATSVTASPPRSWPAGRSPTCCSAATPS